MAATASRWQYLFPDRGRRKAIWAIALPIMGGMMSQNILNLVDIGMAYQPPDSRLLVAEGDGRIVGIAGLQPALTAQDAPSVALGRRVVDWLGEPLRAAEIRVVAPDGQEVR